MWNAISADGKQSAKIELSLSMLPDGKIDHNNIVKQIEEKVGAFNKNIQDFANMYAKVYMMMAEAGLVPRIKKTLRNGHYNSYKISRFQLKMLHHSIIIMFRIVLF